MACSDFIQIKRIRGELLLSQKRNNWGCTLTTKELIFQKPHLSYHLLLDDIIGMVPFPPNLRTRREGWIDLWEISNHSLSTYKITTNRLTIIRRNGIAERGQTDLIVPLNQRFLRYFRRHTDFTFLPMNSLS